MSEQAPHYNSVAPLKNVAALVTLVERVQKRSFNLPGLAVFYGPSGYGKTTAATYASNRFQAYSIMVKSVWTRKKLCEAILAEMGLRPTKTIADMVDQISAQLAITNLPLFVDEADHLVARNMIEVIKDIYEGSHAPMILIGEEQLPQKLQAWERVHGRILSWIAAQPAELSDVEHLAPIYCKGVKLDAPLKQHLLANSARSIRRICVNLDKVREYAKVTGLEEVTLADWGDKSFFTGQAPSPRRAV